MKKWKVFGSVPVGVTITVEAETEEEALDAAYQEFPGLTGYAGNGGLDKIVGVNDTNVSLDSDCGEPTFSEALEQK